MGAEKSSGRSLARVGYGGTCAYPDGVGVGSQRGKFVVGCANGGNAIARFCKVLPTGYPRPGGADGTRSISEAETSCSGGYGAVRVAVVARYTYVAH